MLHYIRLVRPVNLLIIILAQVLVKVCILDPFLRINGSNPALAAWLWLLLILATVLIAAAGYIINDILDVPLDKINKPGRVIIDTQISSSKAEILYYILNGLAVVTGALISFMIKKPTLAIIFIIIATLLYYYSYKYKYLTFWGNFSVSILSAAVILIVWLFEFFALKLDPDHFVESFKAFHEINYFFLGYAGFAFLTSFIRELAKDCQDLEGDRRNGCRTIPVRLGIGRTKSIILILTIILLAAISLSQYFLFANHPNAIALSLIPAQVISIAMIVLVVKADEKRDFYYLSQGFKILMIAGILSMISIPISYQ